MEFVKIGTSFKSGLKSSEESCLYELWVKKILAKFLSYRLKIAQTIQNDGCGQEICLPQHSGVVIAT